MISDVPHFEEKNRGQRNWDAEREKNLNSETKLSNKLVFILHLQFSQCMIHATQAENKIPSLISTQWKGHKELSSERV